MLTNLAKVSIIDVLWDPECSSEWSRMKSYETVTAETILKNGNIYRIN